MTKTLWTLPDLGVEMSLDLASKEELVRYALEKYGRMHRNIAMNYVDIVSRELDQSLRREKVIEIFKRLIDFWESPEYVELIKNDSTPRNIIKILVRRAKEIQKNIVEGTESIDIKFQEP